jgi:ABC-type multidrug transport system ATPase subunit
MTGTRPLPVQLRSATGAPAAVETAGLTKQFGEQVAVDHVDLQVPRGAVYGFLGPNGSGKTTTIRMLLGLITPTAGTVRLLGEPMPGRAAQVLPAVGALVEGPAFHPYLSGRANLERLDAADATADPATCGARVATALSRVGLLPAAAKRYRAYSLGMRQRLGIAAALLQDRELLVLDEPTNGLDPQGTREVRGLVRAVAAEGLSVLISSHLLAEVEQICTHVGIMGGGRLLFQGPLAELPSGRAGGRLALVTPDEARARQVLHRLGVGDVRDAGRGADGARLDLPLGGVAAEDVAAALVRAGVRLRGLTVQRVGLEDVFVELTGEGFDVRR